MAQGQVSDWPQRRTAYDDVAERIERTGLIPECSILRCGNDATVFEESTGAGYCFDHFERLLDRQTALALNPGLASTLPPLHER